MICSPWARFRLPVAGTHCLDRPITGTNLVIREASSGIGLAAALLLAEQCARVAIVCG